MRSARALSSSLSGISSSLVGRSGRVYVRDRLLQRHPTRSELNVYLAHCDERFFVLKPTSRSIFELSSELQHEFQGCTCIRTHVDENVEDNVLVYDYRKDNLLSFIQRTPDLSVKARRSILWEVGSGLQGMHSKEWLHLDLKPNNVVLDWQLDTADGYDVSQVALGDLDCALKLHNDRLLNHRVGNVMWRSPEGQAGKGVGKPSEVFSFGLLCLYTMTGVETLHPDFQQLADEGTEPEHVILYKLLSMLGPAPASLISHIDDPYWTELLTALSDVVRDEDPSLRFENWSEEALPNLDRATKDIILSMISLDPRARPSMDQIMSNPWWNS